MVGTSEELRERKALLCGAFLYMSDLFLNYSSLQTVQDPLDWEKRLVGAIIPYKRGPNTQGEVLGLYHSTKTDFNHKAKDLLE